MGAALLNSLQRSGLTLTVEAEQLRVKGRLTEVQREMIRMHKAELMLALQRTADPRPDLTDDTCLWQKLLARAYAQDGDQTDGVFGVLHGLRCWGARLRQGEKGLQLVPRYKDEGGGWEILEEWLHDKEVYLMPHRAAIRQLLAD